jgi:hypothetical protein
VICQSAARNHGPSSPTDLSDRQAEESDFDRRCLSRSPLTVRQNPPPRVWRAGVRTRGFPKSARDMPQGVYMSLTFTTSSLAVMFIEAGSIQVGQQSWRLNIAVDVYSSDVAGVLRQREL